MKADQKTEFYDIKNAPGYTISPEKKVVMKATEGWKFGRNTIKPKNTILKANPRGKYKIHLKNTGWAYLNFDELLEMSLNDGSVTACNQEGGSPEQTQAAIAVSLPWPNKSLSPNARVHWTVKRRFAAQAKRIACVETLAQKAALKPEVTSGLIRKRLTRLSYRLNFYPPDGRRRDEDNLVASMKHYLDGIAQALELDDYHFHLLEPVFYEPCRPDGKVVVELFFTA